MHGLTGYTDRWSVKPGGRIGFHIASAAPVFSARVVRHLCADPNPEGPGYSEIPMPSPVDGTHPGAARAAFLGSYGHAPGLSVDPSEGLALTATIWPTTPGKGRQGIVCVATPGWTLTLGIGAGGSAMVEATWPGGHAMAEVARPLRARRWYDLQAGIDAAGRLHIAQRPHAPLADAGEAAGQGAPLPAAVASVFLAACGPDGSGVPTSAQYNGKIEAPAVWRSAAFAGPAVAAWDFSIGIPTQTAADTGPSAVHAALHRLPMRAMTGSNWTGAVHDWKSDPAQYGAIHFHDDDQGDLGWPETLAFEIPADWPSGLYALALESEAGRDYIPFIVRPLRPTADAALIIPTFSYQVYSAYVRPGRGAEIAARAAAWGALPETPDMNPEFGLSTYNYHADGSGVALVSMLRPMLDTRTRQFSLMDPTPGGSGTGRLGCDSYFIKWMTDAGIAHDVITDHDIHEDPDILQGYRVVLAAQHPEYHSLRMIGGFERFLETGGRLMYLGGNGFYWRAEMSEHTPHALEVRRAEGGIRVWATEPGESYHQFGGGYGGLLRRVGKSGHRLVGINFSSQGRHLGFPYRFIAGIEDPRVAFMREGLDIAPGTVFGDAGYMGGGAAGFELDSVNFKYGSPPHILTVAKGIVVHPDYGWVNEDMLTHRHPLPPEDWSCADMSFFETESGGAVFSVGSMTYAGSLPVEGGRSLLGRLTENVLRRFLDPAPFALPGA